MIVKPSITFLTNDSDPLLINDTKVVLTNMTGNPAYPTPAPTLAEIQSALDEFIVAEAEAATGGVILTAIKKDKRKVLVGFMRKLASYVQVTCNGDLTVLLSSGFPIQKPQRSPIGVLPAPANLVVGLGALTGELNAGVARVFGASAYNWQLAAASAPTVVLQTAQTTAASNTFSGLTPGVAYLIQANALGAAGPSDWCQPVAQIAM